MRRMKSVLPILLCFLLLLLPETVLADAAIGGEYNFQNANYDVIVSAPDGYVNGRYGPGLEYGIFTPIYNGEVLHVYATQDNYYDGLFWGQTYYNGSYMWISLSQTSPYSAPPAQPSYNAADYYVMVDAWDGYCNLRTGPGIANTIITPIYNGEILHVTQECYNPEDDLLWGYTIYKDQTGWISVSQTSPYAPPAQTETTKAAETTAIQEPEPNESTAAPAEESIPEKNQQREDLYRIWLSDHLADPEDPAYAQSLLNIDQLIDPVFPFDDMVLADVTGDGLEELILTHYYDLDNITGIDPDGDGEINFTVLHPRNQPKVSYTGTDTNHMQVYTIKDGEITKIYEQFADYSHEGPSDLQLVPYENYYCFLNVFQNPGPEDANGGYELYYLNESGNTNLVAGSKWAGAEIPEALAEKIEAMAEDGISVLLSPQSLQNSAKEDVPSANIDTEPESVQESNSVPEDGLKSQSLRDWLQ